MLSACPSAQTSIVRLNPIAAIQQTASRSGKCGMDAEMELRDRRKMPVPDSVRMPVASL
jgi:hypothetical protein